MRLLHLNGNTIFRRLRTIAASPIACCTVFWQDAVVWKDSCPWLDIDCCGELWINSEIWDNKCLWTTTASEGFTYTFPFELE